MKDYMEEIVESVVATVETVEFLHGVPVKLPSQYKADLRGAIREAFTTIDKKAREEEREKLRHLVCPCACDMFIDEEGYEEAHRGEMEALKNN